MAGTIDTDVYCVHCEYNLRGLTARHQCPECGKPVLRSVLCHLMVNAHESWELRTHNLAKHSVLPHRLDCRPVLFVIKATQQLFREQRQAKQVPVGTPVHLGPREICLAVRDYALQQTGHRLLAERLLGQLGLGRSESIGRIMHGMILMGMMTANEGESLADFDGLFTLESLFAAEG